MSNAYIRKPYKVLGHDNSEFRGQYSAMYDVGEGRNKKKSGEKYALVEFSNSHNKGNYGTGYLCIPSCCRIPNIKELWDYYEEMWICHSPPMVLNSSCNYGDYDKRYHIAV